MSARVAGTYESAASYRIAFLQASYWSLADSTQVAEGVLVARPPSSVSIRYSDGGRIAANGESLWVYVPQTSQFFCSPMDADDVAVDPARLLRLYRPDESAPVAASSPGVRAVRFRPLDASAEPSRLLVTFDTARLLVTEIVAHTMAGDRTTYRMLETSFDVPVAPDEFRPVRPEGAQLIRGLAPGSP